MTTPPPNLFRDWTSQVQVVFERSGQFVLGPEQLKILEAIDRWHSISEAARHIGISYRHAWKLVHSISRAAGKPVVETAAGGSRGGGARLTDWGREILRLGQNLRDRLQTAAGALVGQFAGPAAGPVVQLAAAVSLEEVLGRLLADIALQQWPFTISTLFGASDALARQLGAGVQADLFLAADPSQLDELASRGMIVRGSRVILARNTLTAVRGESSPALVRRPADLRRPALQRIACGRPGSPLGDYSTRYLQRQGLYEDLQPRLLAVDNARMVMAAVHGGQAEVGLVYASQAATAGHCHSLFRVPWAAVPIRFAAGVLRSSSQPDHARRVLDFLTSPLARQRFRQCGFLPAT